jgi:diguanylate cyclase (GGDEF)-like protein
VLIERSQNVVPPSQDQVARIAEHRRVLRVGSFLVGVILLATAFLYAGRFPSEGTAIFALWACGAAVNLVIWVVALRASNRFVAPLTVAMTIPSAVALLISAVEPAALLTSASGLSILPVAVPLFMAWTRTGRARWLIAYAAPVEVIILATGFGHMGFVQRVDVATNVAIGVLIGWVGGEMLERLRERAIAQESELRRLNDELLIRATTDALTGLANRRQLDSDLQSLSLPRADGVGSVGFVMLDLDHFKRLNDELGHAVGDAALRSVAAELQRVVRRRDTIYRYGGEEFLVIMRDASLSVATATGERIREAIADLEILGGAGANDRLTISCGVAFSPARREHWDGVLAAADSALYEAKATGRNRVCVAPVSATGVARRLPHERRRARTGRSAHPSPGDVPVG